MSKAGDKKEVYEQQQDRESIIITEFNIAVEPLLLYNDWYVGKEHQTGFYCSINISVLLFDWRPPSPIILFKRGDKNIPS